MPNQLQLAGSPGKPTKFVPLYTSRFFQGLWTQRNPLRSGTIGWQVEKSYGVNNDCLIDGLNTEISNRLTLIRRPGTGVYNSQLFDPINSWYSWRITTTTTEQIVVVADTDTEIYDATGPATKTLIYSKGAGGGPAYFQQVGNILYFGDGDTLMQAQLILGSYVVYVMGLGGAVFAPSGALPYDPTDKTGNWYYAYAYKNSVTGEIGNLSPPGNPITPPVPPAPVNVTIGFLGNGGSPQVDTIVFFRTLKGGTTFYWIGEVPNPGAGLFFYTDHSTDPPDINSTMNILMAGAANLENSPPPQNMINLAFHLNRMWGSSGNVVYFSNPPGYSIGANYTQFPPINYFTFPSRVVRLWPIGTSGILVFTVSDVYIITGTTAATFSPYPFLQHVGLASYNAMTSMGAIICMYTADRQLIMLDPNSGVTEVGFPIGDKLDATFDPAASYVTFHVQGSQDKALYISDGYSGWYRLTPTAPPEAGQTWSPFAEILDSGPGPYGVSAVQSIETAPGVFDLLIGPFSGPT